MVMLFRSARVLYFIAIILILSSFTQNAFAQTENTELLSAIRVALEDEGVNIDSETEVLVRRIAKRAADMGITPQEINEPAPYFNDNGELVAEDTFLNNGQYGSESNIDNIDTGGSSAVGLLIVIGAILVLLLIIFFGRRTEWVNKKNQENQENQEIETEIEM